MQLKYRKYPLYTKIILNDITSIDNPFQWLEAETWESKSNVFDLILYQRIGMQCPPRGRQEEAVKLSPWRQNIYDKEKKEQIWLVRMTNAPTPQTNLKRNVTTQKRHKNFDYTTIADRLRTASWGNDSHTDNK